MYGQVEVYKIISGQEQLIAKESNLIVDGARSLLAEIMTIPPFILTTTASTVLDTSNWTVQAISFGKDSSSFFGNLHTSTVGVIDGTNRPTFDSGNQVPYAWFSCSGVSLGNFNPAAIKINGLPAYPDPIDKVLERGVYPYPLSSTFYQIPNFIQFSSQLGLTIQQAINSGCWPVAGSGGGSPVGTVIHLSCINNNNIDQYDVCIGSYNTLGTMDYRGFVKLNYNASAIPNLAGNFIVSSDPSFSSLRQVAYLTQMYQGDLELLQLYGGIYSIGLWTINMRSMLKNYFPPFIFNLYPSNMDFNLFSKKSFLRDLTYNTTDYLPNTNPPIGLLKIIWRIFF